MYECKLCRKTVFYGRRKHVYEKGHRKRLQELLRAFGDKVAAARRMISAASVEKYDPQQHDRKFWCHCCEREQPRHTTDGGLTVIYGAMLQHLARPEHLKAVNIFWWTHQADVKLKSQFILTSDEYERFKSSVTIALEGYQESEDTLIKQMAEHIQMVEQSRQELVQNSLEPILQAEGQEEECWMKNDDFQCSATSAGCSNIIPSMMADTSLTYIGQQETSERGNVHTGALPPWMISDEEEHEKKEIGPALEDFLKHQEKMKLKKLPPNRVGANFDHDAQTDEGWLPSFGRVWNSGRRWQSRHQYRKEFDNKGTKRKRNEDV